MSLTARRAAENEALFRRANEQIEERLGELTLEGGRSPFLCECEDTTCRDVLRLTREEYEAVREHPRRFIVAFGHPLTHARIVERRDEYLVVEKTGEAGEVAEDLDPRS
jgi:hypothetical protein